MVDHLEDFDLVGTRHRLGKFVVIDQDQLERGRGQQVGLGDHPGHPPVAVEGQRPGNVAAQQDAPQLLDAVIEGHGRHAGIGEMPHRGGEPCQQGAGGRVARAAQ